MEEGQEIGAGVLADVAGYAAALETVRCDDCQCLLSQQERADARDTGFPECFDCAIKRHNSEDHKQMMAETNNQPNN